MCGRFLFIAEAELAEIVHEAEKRLQAANIPYSVKTGTIFPTNFVPVLYAKEGQMVSGGGFWGFTNHLVRENAAREREGKKPLKPKAVFNTRAETAATNGFWRSSFASRRCLIPTSGFFEWQHTGKDTTQEFLFTLPSQPITMAAGLWRLERDEATGLKLPHFSMLTTRPNASIQDVHDRMPVVLRPDEYDQWLHGDYPPLLNRSGISLNRSVV